MSNSAQSNANASGPTPTSGQLPPPLGRISTNPNNHTPISKLAIANKQINNAQNAKVAEEIKKINANKAAAAPAPSGGGLFSMFFGTATAPSIPGTPATSMVGGRRKSRKSKSKAAKSKSKSKAAKSKKSTRK